MNDLSTPPVRTADPFAAWPDDYVCDACCSVDQELTELDGDRLCQTCADAWVRSQRPDDDDLVAPWPGYPFSPKPVDFNMIVAGNRLFNRQNRRAR